CATFRRNPLNRTREAVLATHPLLLLHMSNLLVGSDATLEEIIDDLQNWVLSQDGAGGSNKIDYIVISGNITASGNRLEFERAGKLISTLCRRLLVKDGGKQYLNRLLIVPGTTDVGRGENEDSFDDREFTRFHDAVFATEISEGRVRPYQSAAVCRELKDLT